MKKIAIIFLMAAWMLPAIAQTFSYEYIYDDAGNRTNRNVITLKSTGGNSLLDESNKPISDELKDLEKLSDDLSDFKVTLYPNPTRGELIVQVTPYKEGISGRIVVYDLTGKLIFETSQIIEFNRIDLENQPQGAYILRLSADQKENTYKIIKK